MTPRASVPRWVALPALAAMIVALTACGAPRAEPASGPVADDVRAAIDSGTERFAHERWDRLLAEGTHDGLVDYRYFQRHRDELDAYLERVADADLASLAPDHLKALLINAYNAYTIVAILEHPEVASIREIDGVWTETTHAVGGHPLTLDEIEHELLRPFFRDPRIHFAVNCASRSCAPLPPWAFGGDSLDAQLEERSRSFLRDRENVRVEDGELLLTRYFDWYGDDFTSEGWEPRAATIPRFVATYARPAVVKFVAAQDGRPSVSFLDYDWSLNAAVPPETDVATGPTVRLTLAGPAAGLDASVAMSAAVQESDSPPDEGWVASLRRWVSGFGAAAPLVYGLAYVLATVFFVPGSALTIGAGVAFGLLWGTVLVSVASTVGAALCFLLARYFLRARVESWVEGHEKFVMVDRAVARKDWKIVALTRLSPVFPFNLQNYAYGLTGVGFRGYVLASWIAMLPGTLLYVYLGAAGVQVAAAATGTAGWGQTVLQLIGLAATLAVAVIAGRIATRVLRETAGEDGGGGDSSPGRSSTPSRHEQAATGREGRDLGAPRTG